MKTLKTKVILSAVVLLFALVATIGSTFAWFTVSSSVEVDTMELNVSTTDSLLIKVYEGETDPGTNPELLDASQYKTFIPIEDIEVAYPNIYNWRLTPVTVIDSTYTGILASGFNTLTAANTDVKRALSPQTTNLTNHINGFVIQLQFWVLSQGSALNTHLIVQDLNVSNTGPSTQDAVENAVRLAVKAGAGSRYIFGLTNDYGFNYVQNLPGFFDDEAPAPQTATYTGSVLNGFNELADLVQGYNGEGSNVDVEALINGNTLNGLYFDSTPLADAVPNATTVTEADATKLVTLVQNVPTLVTVTIFVEGWSAGAINNIIAAEFGISFKFSLFIQA